MTLDEDINKQPIQEPEHEKLNTRGYRYLTASTVCIIGELITDVVTHNPVQEPSLYSKGLMYGMLGVAAVCTYKAAQFFHRASKSRSQYDKNNMQE